MHGPSSLLQVRLQTDQAKIHRRLTDGEAVDSAAEAIDAGIHELNLGIRNTDFHQRGMDESVSDCILN